MARVIWTERALQDLERVLDYIAADAPLAARRFAQRIIARTDSLSHTPRIGGFVEEDDTRTYRQLVQGNYRNIYRVDDDTVYIVAVHHAARLLDVDEL